MKNKSVLDKRKITMEQYLGFEKYVSYNSLLSIYLVLGGLFCFFDKQKSLSNLSQVVFSFVFLFFQFYLEILPNFTDKNFIF